jgi:hypothetical protein
MKTLIEYYAIEVCVVLQTLAASSITSPLLIMTEATYNFLLDTLISEVSCSGPIGCLPEWEAIKENEGRITFYTKDAADILVKGAY